MTDADHEEFERATEARGERPWPNRLGDALRSWALRRLGVPCGGHRQ